MAEYGPRGSPRPSHPTIHGAENPPRNTCAQALTAEDLRDPVISSRIAAAMAKLHQLPPLLVGAEPHRSAEQAPAQLCSKMFDVLEDWLDNASRPHSQLGGEEASVPDAGQEAAGVASRPRVGSEGESSDHGGELFACDAASSPTEHAAAPELSLDVLRQETRCLRELLAAYPSPVVFCHNDLQYGNIMRTRSGDIKLIDFEYSFLNCRAFDIANHFCEWAADYHNDVPHRMDFSRLPSADQRLAFCQSYLDALREFSCSARRCFTPCAISHPRAPPFATAGDEKPSAESLLREVEPFTMASHLLWAIWGVIQARGAAPGFDYKEYARGRFERYCEEKRAHEEAAAC